MRSHYKKHSQGELKVDILRVDILRSLDENHMWINAFSCLNPSDDMKRQIGEWVLDKLASKEKTLPAMDLDAADSDPIDTMQILTGHVYLRFNKS